MHSSEDEQRHHHHHHEGENVNQRHEMGGGVRITKGHESGGGHIRITLGHEKEGDIKTNKNTQLGTQKNNKIKNVHLGPNKEIM